jgi:hypothetical protein
MNDSPKMIENAFSELMRQSGLSNCAAAQRKEMRRFFFAGSRFYSAFVMEHADGGNDATDQDMAMMEALEIEMAGFVQDVENGLA